MVTERVQAGDAEDFALFILVSSRVVVIRLLRSTKTRRKKNKTKYTRQYISSSHKSVVPSIVLCAFHSTLIPLHLLSSYQWLLNLPLLLAKPLLPPPLKHPQNRPKVQRQPRRLPSLRLLRVKRRSERRSERRHTLLISTRVGLLQCLVDVCSRRV